MTRLAPLIAATLVVAVAACAPAVHDATEVSARSSTLPVTGFQQGGDPTSLIARYARQLRVVGVDGVTIAESGAGLNPVDADVDRQRAAAQRVHLPAELLVSNYSDRVGDFSEPLAHALLGSSAHRRTVVAQLGRTVRARGWNGVNVDLESLQARDAAGLTAFLRELRAALPAHVTLAICLMAATHTSEYAADGYDLRAIGAVADRVLVMTYDEHGTWEDTPGPVGALSWQRAAITALARAVPRSKVELGVAGYGYRWGPHGNDQLTVAEARRAAGTRARFDARAGEWTATLADGSVLWWSDSRSLRLRRQLAAQLQVHGLAVWSLGQTDGLG